ncbi:squalene synthase HpnC [Actinomadura rayongensis]|uniref:Squalene synthase HpnC n=1 Tax=Actinomadura rayongensis TaxID=1429076 RepID=A0A6I4WMM9_9ACTN|nr:squalene synthase HpnC [Actinomadura rayongensis]
MAAPSWSFDEHDRTLDVLVSRENFPVAARVLPARHRADLRAVYGFARLVDDIGDEAPPERRPALLDLIDDELDAVYAGREPRLPQMRRLAPTVKARGIPSEPFRDLVQANRQDQVVDRYGTFDELLKYCTLSAEPVGRIVLHVFGRATPELVDASDRVCSALQVIEHCQDVGEDYARGRIYLPGEDLRRFGCAEEDLALPHTPARLRGVVALQASRARDLLEEGAPVLLAGLTGWARLAVAGYVAGGRATLAALDRGRHDVLGRRLRPGRARTLAGWASALGRG